MAGATVQVLTSLSDRSLLETVRLNNRGSGLRYRMHELIKQFSSEKLAEDLEELEQMKDLHRSFYMRFLNDRNSKVMGGTASYQAVQEVRGETENVRLALERAIAQGNLDELGNSLNILMFFYEIQGLFEEAERVFRQIRQRMEELVHVSHEAGDNAMLYLGRAEMYHGWYCMHLARFDQAIEFTQKGLEISRQSGDMEGYGLALNSLGIIAINQGKYRQAESYLQDAIEVLYKYGYTWSESGALGNLGFLALKEGNPLRGSDLFQQSLVLHTQLNDEWGMAGDLDGLGDAALQLGKLEQAEKYFRQVLEIRRKYGQRWRAALSLNRLGDVAYRRRHYDEARKDYQEGLSILRDIGERFYITSALVRYGEICTALGEYEQAKESCQTSLKLAKEIGAYGIALRALLGLAGLLAIQGDREQSAIILAAVYEHPSLEYEDRARAGQLLAELQEDIPPQASQSVVENGKGAILDDLVRDILRSGV